MLKRITVFAFLLAVLVQPSTSAASWPSYGLSAWSQFLADRDDEPHPKKLQLQLVIRKEMGVSDGAARPLYFGVDYANRDFLGDDPLAKKGKVTLKVTVYRGGDVLWSGKRSKKLANEPARHLFCDPLAGESLRAGDLVVFDFRFKKVARLGELEGVRLLGGVGPAELRTLDFWRWSPPRFECPDAPLR